MKVWHTLSKYIHTIHTLGHLAVQVNIGALEGPILVQCIPCTARLSIYFGIFY